MKSYLIIALSLIAAFTLNAKSKWRSIKRVQAVNVVTPVGHAPRLPWQVWVTYNDGVGEWRQVVWTNTSLEQERSQADAVQTPAGSTYTVRGYIIGDNTTPDGFPVDAHVKVATEQSLTATKPQIKVEPLPLDCVRLTGTNRLTSNRQLDLKMLLSLDVSQQLYNYRDTYGLPTDGYTVADGWDSPTTKLKGHGTGHYLSALAHAYAGATDDETITLDNGTTLNLRRELSARMERMVNELRACQERTFVYSDSLGRYLEARDYAPADQLRSMKGSWAAFNEYKKDYRHYGYGYLNAIPAAHPVLVECYRQYNNEEWVWAPYYSIHKQLAGLIDIAAVMHNATGEKALLIARDMGLWVWNRMHYRTFCLKQGTTAERRAMPGNRFEMWNIYIAGEVGGMAESLARLAEMTADEKQKAQLIEAANCFDAPAFFDPVERGIDDIRTRHANQHIPMIVGALRSYRLNSDLYYYRLADNFWTFMQGRYAYAMGGVGNGEMWRQPYTQMMSMNTSAMQDRNGNRVPNPDLNETCCAYNLAKLTKDLNCFNPDDARYMDYYERLLCNQLVGSVHPEAYSVCYQYAVGLNARKPFGSVTPQETCCGGTGAENHVKYQEAAYFVGNDDIYVGLYLPTEARWEARGMTIRQECEWPAERSVIRMSGKSQVALHLRVPYWATEGFDVRLNGKSIAAHYQPCSYVEIPRRAWTDDDVVEVVMPFTKHICYGADKMDMAFTADNGGSNKPFAAQWVGALMYGPLVMTSPDIHTWDEASLSLAPDLSDVAVTSAAPYTLSVAGKSFVPDYYVADEHTTHYLRLDIASGKGGAKGKHQLNVEKLKEKISAARERIASQQQWEAMPVKVPEYAPWATHGFARLQQCVADAEALCEQAGAKHRTVSQTDIDYAASSLSVAIIGMRPGNLAEPEDLAPLLAAIERAKPSARESQEVRKAIEYGRMVVRYVNDGSGTKDMIRRALSRF